jgi:hypothetical protein
LTAAQRRAIGLAGTPTLAALRTEAAYDQRAIDFLNKRFDQGKVSAKNYTDQLVSLKNDLASVTGEIKNMTKETEKSTKTVEKARHAVGGAAGAYGGAATGGGEPKKPRPVPLGFTVPLGLQLQQARAEAAGKNLLPILRRMRTAAEKALKSGKLSVQAQIDAYNEIADLNSQIKDLATSTKKSVDGVKPMKWAWLGNQVGWKLVPASAGRDLAAPPVSAAVTARINARLDRMPPLLPLADARHPYAGITINGGLHLHGVQDVRGLETQLTRRTQQRPQTRRGPV